MNSFQNIGLASCLALSFCLPAGAEVMKKFHSDIQMDQTGAADVTETIEMDFQGEERHGIIRHIPVSIKRKQTPYSIYFKLLSITDGQNQPLQYKESRDGAEVDLKIGDPEKVLTGRQDFKIKYRIKRVINWIGGRPEFYWNATGDQWHFPIQNADAMITLPPGIPANLTNVVAFQGTPGSRTPAKSELTDGGVDFSCSELPPGQGLTIAVQMPMGTLHEPTAGEELLWWLVDWWPAVAVPLAGFAAMFWLWFTGGRDIDGGKAIAVDWNPPAGLSPAEVGTLVDERCDLHDITSTLVDLAVRGYLKIKETKSEKFFFMTNKDYELEKTDPTNAQDVLKPHEKLFLNSVFPNLTAGTVVTLSSLKGSFYPCLAGIRQDIYESLTTQGLFRNNPEKTRAIYYCLGVAIFFCALCAFGYSGPLGMGSLLLSVIVMVFAGAMPSRTAKGSQKTREALGFARFVQKAEKDRIRVLASEDPTIFGRLLPFAMVLGAADQWAQAFKDLAIEPPSWYVSSGGYDSYNTSLFVNDLGYGMRSFEQTFTTAPPSGSGASSAWSGGSAFSGGGSGGGFGGGGGSSW